MLNKQAWLDWAEIFDTWRIVPRLILFLYGAWMVRVTSWIMSWYEHLPSVERTVQVTTVIVTVIPGVFGLAVWVYKIYSTGGRDWTQGEPPTTIVNNQMVAK